MPVIQFQDHEFRCSSGVSLRQAMQDAGMTPHNGSAGLLNCKGLGTCGTCAVKITGQLHEPTWRERLRLNFPPHRAESGLRLACQVRVEHDLVVQKFDGFWGHKV